MERRKFLHNIGHVSALAAAFPALSFKDLDFTKFDIIYAGAQKNMGPAGTTLVVVKEDVIR